MDVSVYCCSPIVDRIYDHLAVFGTFAGNVNFLIADGLKFSHPLHHLGKGPEVLSNK